MAYQNPKINEVADLLRVRMQILDNKADILKAAELRALYGELKTLEPEQRASYGKEINDLKKELEDLVETSRLENEALPAIDVTAPWDVNTPAESRPKLLPSEHGTQHPLTTEISHIVDIFSRMGFAAYPSREIDDEYHMFTSLNFPAGHPARDDYDTFMTEQVDKTGEPFIAPAHTSTMQHRIIKAGKADLENNGTPIAAIIADRVFRNEDLDATHEHTFYQLEGVYVGKGVHAGMLIATLETYLSEYFGEKLKTKLQPFYFPFTEPSFEFAVERPAILRKNNSEEQKWLELGGCGMIHPNVLKQAGVDPTVYTGFAWGFGIERMVMMKNGIEDVRHFESAKLDFLRQF